ncbi:hypothetical protein NMY22_g12627 [Coprinellus aureogranulatus]|nr:hypothetical protein NMY22_g12627 [Coprinellus aureogranulatus]
MRSSQPLPLSATEEVVQGLRSAIVDLQGQIEELKQDKRDLRSDKESLRSEVASLREDLKEVQGRSNDLAQDVQKARSEAEEWKKQCELAKIALESLNRLEPKASTTQIQCEAVVDPVPAETSPSDCVQQASTLAAPQVASSSLLSTAPRPEVYPPRKAVTLADGSRGTSPAKRVATVKKLKLSSHTSHPGVPLPGTSHPGNTSSNVGQGTFAFKRNEAFVLHPDVLAQYLSRAPTFDINPPPSDLYVSREFLSNIYGGSSTQSAQHVMPPDNPSNFTHRAFTFPKFELNPQMPLNPGQSGVIVASRYDRKTGHPWGLFRRDISGKTQTWIYLGEYEWSAAGKMSVEIFRNQKEKVKLNWANELLGSKRGLSDYYVSMRARIALRKAGLLPAQDSASERKLVDRERALIAAYEGHPVSQQDIIDAFERGDEVQP